MPDDIDALFADLCPPPPPDFAARMTALARETPQPRRRQGGMRPWQWLSLGAGAGLGSWALCEFVFFAFVAAGAR